MSGSAAEVAADKVELGSHVSVRCGGVATLAQAGVAHRPWGFGLCKQNLYNYAFLPVRARCARRICSRRGISDPDAISLALDFRRPASSSVRRPVAPPARSPMSLCPCGRIFWCITLSLLVRQIWLKERACAIAGEIRLTEARQTLRAVVDDRVAAGRGPDGYGVSVSGQSLRASSPQDHGSSDAAQQPMVDPQLGLGIVFNGAKITTRSCARNSRRWATCSTRMATPKCCSRPITPGVRDFRAAPQRHVRLRDLGARFRSRAAGARSARNQAALLRGTWRRLALRLDPAGPARRWRCRHLDRSAGAQSLPSFHAVVPAPHTLFAGCASSRPAA